MEHLEIGHRQSPLHQQLQATTLSWLIIRSTEKTRYVDMRFIDGEGDWVRVSDEEAVDLQSRNQAAAEMEKEG
jgi:hypothetical protein